MSTAAYSSWTLCRSLGCCFHAALFCFWSPWSLSSVSSPQREGHALLGSPCCVMAWKPKAVSWVRSRVYLICFSYLEDHCLLMPDAQCISKVFQIFCVCGEGGGKGGVEEKENYSSWGDKCNSCYSILAKNKSTILVEWYLSDKELQGIHKMQFVLIKKKKNLKKG